MKQIVSFIVCISLLVGLSPGGAYSVFAERRTNSIISTIDTANAAVGDNIPRLTPAEIQVNAGALSDISINYDCNDILGVSRDTITSITNGTGTLIPNVDYRVSGNVVTIGKSYQNYYFTKFPNQNLYLKFNFASENSTVLTVYTGDTPNVVIDNNLSYTSGSGDVKLNFVPNGNFIVGIKNGDSPLIQRIDYTYEPSTHTLYIRKGFLDSYFSKASEPLKLTVSFTGDAPKTVTISPSNNPGILNAAIYSIGDLYANGINNATIDGNVYVFGTGTSNKNEPRNYYYGGIYALNNSNLYINGSAYTNSLIRTGAYSNSLIRTGTYSNNSDNSVIHVLKDAVALRVQVFGKGDKIVVHDNAYTFDDLEMDGEDSVIAVNGNYYGLSYSDSLNDASSAVINAAPVHWLYSPDSLKSRIVINGDVLINGGVFKIDPGTGDKRYELENGAFAYKKDGSIYDYIPFYKEFDDSPYATKEDKTINYINTLRAPGGYGGFLNLFQLCSKVDEGNIQNWLEAIDAVRGRYPNDIFNAPTKYPLSIPKQLSGFCNCCVAANDTMYFLNSDTYSYDGTSNVGFKPIRYKPDLPEILNQDMEYSTYWDNLFNISNDASWKLFYGSSIGTPNSVTSKLSTLGSKLYDKISVLATRDYPVKQPLGVSNKINTNFNIYTKNNKAKPIFSYWMDSIDSKCGGIGEAPAQHILHYTGSAYGGSINICNVIKSYGVANTDYFLVINEDPTNEIIVDNVFNGIICTNGRVRIKDGALITGSIIAAGNDYDSSNKITGSIAEYNHTTLQPVHMPEINSANVDQLDKGYFAGVYFDSGNHSSVIFPGRQALLNNIYLYTHINLEDIF